MKKFIKINLFLIGIFISSFSVAQAISVSTTNYQIEACGSSEEFVITIQPSGIENSMLITLPAQFHFRENADLSITSGQAYTINAGTDFNSFRIVGTPLLSTSPIVIEARLQICTGFTNGNLAVDFVATITNIDPSGGVSIASNLLNLTVNQSPFFTIPINGVSNSLLHLQVTGENEGQRTIEIINTGASNLTGTILFRSDYGDDLEINESCFEISYDGNSFSLLSSAPGVSLQTFTTPNKHYIVGVEVVDFGNSDKIWVRECVQLSTCGPANQYNSDYSLSFNCNPASDLDEQCFTPPAQPIASASVVLQNPNLENITAALETRFCFNRTTADANLIPSSISFSNPTGSDPVQGATLNLHINNRQMPAGYTYIPQGGLVVVERSQDNFMTTIPVTNFSTTEISTANDFTNPFDPSFIDCFGDKTDAVTELQITIDEPLLSGWQYRINWNFRTCLPELFNEVHIRESWRYSLHFIDECGEMEEALGNGRLNTNIFLPRENMNFAPTYSGKRMLMGDVGRHNRNEPYEFQITNVQLWEGNVNQDALEVEIELLEGLYFDDVYYDGIQHNAALTNNTIINSGIDLAALAEKFEIVLADGVTRLVLTEIQLTQGFSYSQTYAGVFPLTNTDPNILMSGVFPLEQPAGTRPNSIIRAVFEIPNLTGSTGYREIPPSLFDASIRVRLAAVCRTNASNITMRTFHILDRTCQENSRVPLAQISNVITVACPGCDKAGPLMENYEIHRTTYGTSDPDNDMINDFGAVNENTLNVRSNRAFVGDRLEGNMSSKVVVYDASYQNFGTGKFDFAYYDIQLGPCYEEVSVESIEVTLERNGASETIILPGDAFDENGNMIPSNLDGVGYDNTLESNDGNLSCNVQPNTHHFILNFASLSSISEDNGAGTIANFAQQEYLVNDIINIQTNFRVVGNIGAAERVCDVQNTFYFGVQEEPTCDEACNAPIFTGNGCPTLNTCGDGSCDANTQYMCADINTAQFTLYGFEATLNHFTSSENCINTIFFNGRITIGSMGNASDPFPFEFRNLASFDEVNFRLPPNYNFIEDRLSILSRRKGACVTLAERIKDDVVPPIIAINSPPFLGLFSHADFEDEYNGNQANCDPQGHTNQGISPSDGGWDYSYQIDLAPQCDADTFLLDTLDHVVLFVNGIRDTLIDPDINPDGEAFIIRPNIPTEIEGRITTNQHVVTGDPIASWDLEVENREDEDLPFLWFTYHDFKDMIETIEICELDDSNTPTGMCYTSPISPGINDMAPILSINGSELNSRQKRKYRITVTYNCSQSPPETLRLFVGGSCVAPPESLTSPAGEYACIKDTLDFELTPRTPEFEFIDLTVTPELGTPCLNSETYSFHVSNKDLGTYRNMIVSLDVPNGIIPDFNSISLNGANILANQACIATTTLNPTETRYEFELDCLTDTELILEPADGTVSDLDQLIFEISANSSDCSINGTQQINFDISGISNCGDTDFLNDNDASTTTTINLGQKQLANLNLNGLCSSDFQNQGGGLVSIDILGISNIELNVLLTAMQNNEAGFRCLSTGTILNATNTTFNPIIDGFSYRISAEISGQTCNGAVEFFINPNVLPTTCTDCPILPIQGIPNCCGLTVTDNTDDNTNNYNNGISLREAIHCANLYQAHALVDFAPALGLNPVIQVVNGNFESLTNSLGVDIWGTSDRVKVINNVSATHGIQIETNNSHLQAIELVDFQHAIVVDGNNNTIYPNIRIVDNLSQGGNGISVISTSSNTQIGGEVKKGNKQVVIGGFTNGISLTGTVDETKIEGTTIGGSIFKLLTTYDYLLPNHVGINIDANVQETYIGPHQGKRKGHGNLIVGNTKHGITVRNDDTYINYNHIGILPDNTDQSLGNNYGIFVSTASNSIWIGEKPNLGNVIANNNNTGIELHGDHAVLKHNFIGTDRLSSIGIGNRNSGIDGIHNFTYVENNVISGNVNAGYRCQGGYSHLKKNKIGVDALGKVALANGSGISISKTSQVNGASGAIIERNICSGNIGRGAAISSDGAIIKDNTFGLDITNLKKIPNGTTGLSVSFSTGNFVFNNHISGNDGQGLNLQNTSDNRIYNNKIGTNINLIDLGNGLAGILVFVEVNGSSPNTKTLIYDNEIRHNDNGVEIKFEENSNIEFHSNNIAFNTHHGFKIGHSVSPRDILIGGDRANNLHNHIFNNGGSGIAITGASPITIQENEIYSNNTKAIALILHTATGDIGNEGISAPLLNINAGVIDIAWNWKPGDNICWELFSNNTGNPQDAIGLALTGCSNSSSVTLPALQSGSNTYYVATITDEQGNTSELSNMVNFGSPSRMGKVDNENFLALKQNTEAATLGFEVFPNPNASGKFNLRMVNLNKNESTTIEVMDTYGKLIFEQKMTGSTDVIDISSYAKGIYYLRITNDNGIQTQKIIYQ